MALTTAGARTQDREGAMTSDRDVKRQVAAHWGRRAAGFDESAAVTMMQRLREIGGDHPEDSLGAYFASHPPFKVRIRELRRLR